MAWDPRDPPSPLSIFRGFLGAALTIATLALVVSCVATGSGEWHLWAFAGMLWLVWAAFEDIVAIVVRPFTGFIRRNLGAGFAADPLGDAAPPISIDDEVPFLEHMIANPPSPHRAIMAGIRLAEIYRTHLHDDAKADALLDRLRGQYPDAHELDYLRPPGGNVSPPA